MCRTFLKEMWGKHISLSCCPLCHSNCLILCKIPVKKEDPAQLLTLSWGVMRDTSTRYVRLVEAVHSLSKFSMVYDAHEYNGCEGIPVGIVYFNASGLVRASLLWGQHCTSAWKTLPTILQGTFCASALSAEEVSGGLLPRRFDEGQLISLYAIAVVHQHWGYRWHGRRIQGEGVRVRSASGDTVILTVDSLLDQPTVIAAILLPPFISLHVRRKRFYCKFKRSHASPFDGKALHWLIEKPYRKSIDLHLKCF